MSKRIAGVILASILLAGLTTVALAKLKDPFVGAWEAEDFDDSHQWMWIERNLMGVYRVTYYDDLATICGGTPSIVIGSGRLASETVLQMDIGAFYCLGDLPTPIDDGGWAAQRQLEFETGANILVEEIPGWGLMHWVGSQDDRPEKIIGEADIDFPAPPDYQTVFVTSHWFPGHELWMSMTLVCQGTADNAGLQGEYKPWLSYYGYDPDSSMTHSELPYRLVDGTLVANDWADLTDGSLENPINLNEGGNQYDGLVWTGTLIDGTPAGGYGSNCKDWDKGSTGLVGSSSHADSLWTDYAESTSCEMNYPIYCIGQ